MLSVLNTRPVDQSKQLNALIQAMGGQVFDLPVFYIQPIAFSRVDFSFFDYCIFTSVNAVKYFYEPGMPLTNCIAIGPETKKALHHAGAQHVILPTEFNSEGVLALLELQQVAYKKIAIIGGKNPRPLLVNMLEKRGALVDMIACYQRVPRRYDMQRIFPELQRHAINIVISTSLESLQALLRLFQDPLHRAWLLRIPFCVINDAMRVTAQSHGVENVIQAENATSEAIANTLKTL